MPWIPPPVDDEAAMLASTPALGDYFWRTDVERFFRFVGTDPTNLADWTVTGLPRGATIYEDPVTGDLVVARSGEANTFLSTASGGGGSTGTVVDGGFPDSSFGGSSPVDGGTP